MTHMKTVCIHNNNNQRNKEAVKSLFLQAHRLMMEYEKLTTWRERTSE
jgi:hypothetical protein